MVFDINMRLEVIEIISISFKPNEINEIGKAIFSNFDLHTISKTRSFETLSSRRASVILVDYCIEKKKQSQLLEFIIDINGAIFLGHIAVVEGLEPFLVKLSIAGYSYNPVKRKVLFSKEDPLEQKNWGALKSGKEYPMTICSLDIVENSKLVKSYGAGTMKKLYSSLGTFLRERMVPYNGRIWSWAGDGGIIAFAMKDNIVNAVQFAIEIQNTMMLFNHHPSYPLKEPIKLRIGLDTGKVPFTFPTGQIVSEVINSAAHIEKSVCTPGSIGVSSKVYSGMGKGYAQFFEKYGKFEGDTAYHSPVLAQLGKEPVKA